MAANPTQQASAEAFTAPAEADHRRYEALRAYYVDGLSLREAGEKFGYTRWAMSDLVCKYKAGALLRPLEGRHRPGDTSPATSKCCSIHRTRK